MSSPLYTHTAARLAEMLGRGEVSSRELVTAFIERADAVEPAIHAFNSRDPEEALRLAAESDERRAKGGSLGPLDGIPVGIKDAISVKGQPLTCSSKMLEKFISPYDAHCIELLRKGGAIPWGRLNMDEFAMGSSTENSAFGPSRNPWNTECVPGGSSGGSAAAVAACEAPFALGSDTGGSIRQPSALCGLVGLKPTYGLVSRYGLVAFASSLDQIGPIAHTVEDVALLLNAIVGHDRRDSTSLQREAEDYTRAIRQPEKGKWRIGLPKEYFGNGMSPEVKAAVDKAIAFYESNGHELVPVSLPHTDLGVVVYYIVAPAEASSNLARYDGVRYTCRSAHVTDAIDLYSKTRAEAFGAEVKRRIILGTYVLSSGYYDAYYLRAQKVRTLIRNDFEEAFKSVDVLLTPAVRGPAFRFGEKAESPLEMYLNDIYTIATNLAGLPAMSVPCGFSSEKLPIGFQLIGPAFGERNILSVARLYESAHDHWKQMPQL